MKIVLIIIVCFLLFPVVIVLLMWYCELVVGVLEIGVDTFIKIKDSFKRKL